MVKTPFFSIVTVCYNAENTITDTIKSVIDQSCTDYEYIIVDGESTDSTLKIIDNLIEPIREKTKIISEADTGIYDAMNKGVRMSVGRFICLLNADDWFEPGCLEKVKEVFNEYQIKNDTKEKDEIVIYGGQRTMNDGMEQNCVFYNHHFLNRTMICHQACFTSKSCYEKFGLFDTRFKSAGDYDFTLRLFLSGEVVFVPIHEVLVNFRVGGMHASNIGRAESNKIRYEQGVISKREKLIESLKIFVSDITYTILRRKPHGSND